MKKKNILSILTSLSLCALLVGCANTSEPQKPEEEELVKPFYADLVAAYKEVDGTYRLEEKIIYTRVEKKDEGYTIYLYKDYGQTQLIETKLNQTEEMLKENPIDIQNYKEKASTIKYHFGLFNNMLYFDSSEIS